MEAESEAARRRDEENRFVRRLVEDCRALLVAGNLDQASARSAELAANYPAEAAVTELREEVSRRVHEKRELRRREAESLLERGRETAMREAIAEIQWLLAQDKLLPAVAAANAALERFPGEPRLVQLRQEAQQSLARSLPETPMSRTSQSSPRSTPMAESEPRRWKMVVIIVCVFAAVVLIALFLLQSYLRPRL
jgi:hypothetical protein